MPSKVLEGPQLIRVGERPPGDKKYATDEYLLAPPGTIVAPRLKDEEPTPENAFRAVLGKAAELGMFGGDMAKGPSAYQKYANSRSSKPSRGPKGRPASRSGPKVYRRLERAAVGAATAPPGKSDPVGDALRAIASVQAANAAGATQEGWQNFANLDATGSATTAPAGTTIPFAEGGDQFSGLMQSLLAAAGITGPENNLAQLAVMQSLGRIDPRALGVTDPAKFRELLAQGQGMPTLDAKKQSFNESLYGFSRSAPSRGNVAQTGVM